jgi:hypothetical protein
VDLTDALKIGAPDIMHNKNKQKDLNIVMVMVLPYSLCLPS